MIKTHFLTHSDLLREISWSLLRLPTRSGDFPSYPATYVSLRNGSSGEGSVKVKWKVGWILKVIFPTRLLTVMVVRAFSTNSKLISSKRAQVQLYTEYGYIKCVVYLLTIKVYLKFNSYIQIPYFEVSFHDQQIFLVTKENLLHKCPRAVLFF